MICGSGAQTAQSNPPLPAGVIATSPAEKRRMREAELRRANRLAERAQILSGRAREHTQRSTA